MNQRYLFVGLVLGLVGCAHQVPWELQDARQARQRVVDLGVADASPADAYLARRSLSVAEAAYQADGDTSHTRALAYVALCRAQRAVIQHRTRTDEARLAALEAGTASEERVASQPPPLAMPPTQLASK